jgi:NAD(P)H-dependent flavin oxidoreductase YrpB (nitropropane dioxygenase family)
MKTAITQMFDITYPFIGGTMAHISNADFVAAVSDAGALGILASTLYNDRQSFRDALKTIKDKTDKPFAVNLNLFPSVRPIDNDALMDVLLEEGVKIVETSGGRAPDDIIARLKPEGVKLIHKCVGVKYAVKVEQMGVDVVTVVGYENGGATGMLDITTLCLIPAVINAVDVPVIGGGGIATGNGIAALLSLGAEAVIIGTRLLLTEECPIHDNLKQALLSAKETDTALIMRSIKNTHRCWVNETIHKVQALEAENAPLEKILPVISGEETKTMYEKGDLSRGHISCGQGIGQMNKILPVKELFAQLAEELKSANQRLTQILN